MKLNMNRALLLSLVILSLLVGCSSFPRTSVDTDEQDATIAVHDTSYAFENVDTVYLNYTIHILDTTGDSTSNINKPTEVLASLKANLEAYGYVVDSISLDEDELEDADLSGMKIINLTESVNEFTVYYYYYYWGWYYPPYYGGWYSYTYKVGTLIVGMLDGDEDKEVWTGIISGFQDKSIPQTTRITNGFDELFSIPPFAEFN